MTATFTPASQAPGVFPHNLSHWTGEIGLAQLAEAIARDTWTTLPGSLEGNTAAGSDDRLLAVLAGCYAAGIFAAEDIEWAASVKPLVRLLSGGHEISQIGLQRFQRTHRPLLETCLSRLIYTAWQTQSVLAASDWNGVAGRELEHLVVAAAEARRRIELARQFNLAFSE